MLVFRYCLVATEPPIRASAELRPEPLSGHEHSSRPSDTSQLHGPSRGAIADTADLENVVGPDVVTGPRHRLAVRLVATASRQRARFDGDSCAGRGPECRASVRSAAVHAAARARRDPRAVDRRTRPGGARISGPLGPPPPAPVAAARRLSGIPLSIHTPSRRAGVYRRGRVIPQNIVLIVYEQISTVVRAAHNRTRVIIIIIV